MDYSLPRQIDHLPFFWILMPPSGRTWHMTLDSFRQALLRRNPEEFTRVWDHPGDGRFRGVTMSFGITLDDERVEGFAGVPPRSEGAAIQFATPIQAVEFAGWLGREIVPQGEPIQISTREGTEAEVADITVEDVSPEPLLGVLLDHVRQALAWE